MRTFNGLQIFTEQLTNSGQLDLRYVRITGNDSEINLNGGIRLGPGSAPTGVYSPGYSGQIAWDNQFMYICSSGNGSEGNWYAIPVYVNWTKVT
jgi:hypothetical protein